MADNVAGLLEELAMGADVPGITVKAMSGEAVFKDGVPIIDTNIPAEAPVDDDGYLHHFNEIAGNLDAHDVIVGQIASAGDQDSRLAAALKFIAVQHELNEKMYSLLVKMDAAWSK